MNNIVYHGSENGNLEIIRANISAHQKKCIYASENKVVAMLFMGKGMGDLDTVKLYDNGIPILVERRDGLLEKIYNKPGYIYVLDATTVNYYEYLWEPEVISFVEELKPIKKVYYNNILDNLIKEERNGNIRIYKYPNRPNCIPLDNSDLIDRYISFEKQGIEHAVDSLLEVYPEFKNKVLEKLLSK